MKKAISGVLLLSSIFASCSKPSSSGDNKPNIVRYNSFSTTPIFLTSQAEHCQDDGKQLINSTYGVSLLKNGFERYENLYIDHLLDMQYIRSENADIVSSTFKNQKTSKEYDITWNEYYQDYRDKELVNSSSNNDGETILLCSSIDELENDSIETAAVKVNYYIDKTYKAVKSLSLGINIKPINVFISPSHKSKYNAVKNDEVVMTLDNMYETDNAYYHPTY